MGTVARFVPLAVLLAWLANPCPGQHAGPVAGPLRDAELPQGRRFFSHLATGGTGPGIDYNARRPFLNGALLPQSGWPEVLLDHFTPRPGKLCDLWLVQTRDVPPGSGTDPWPCLQVSRFDATGRLTPAAPDELLAAVAGRPVLIQVQGHLTTPDVAVGGLLWAHTWLSRHHALPPDAVLIAFDWPSERQHLSRLRGANDASQRALIAGSHLATFLQAFPPHSRVCLLGHSYGGRVVPAALHLLAGGVISLSHREPPFQLPAARPDVQLRAVVVEAAAGRDWLLPGERLDHALPGCEGLLNLYNSRDHVLLLYPLLCRESRQALGRTGLSAAELARLGPQGCRYAEKDLAVFLGREHTLLHVLANPTVAEWLAPYLWAAPFSER